MARVPPHLGRPFDFGKDHWNALILDDSCRSTRQLASKMDRDQL